ncbi:3-hydroxyacyl-ACP dehydratase FabZ family protein [Streptomyces sp. TR06-5]|uniref:3-hydroxyacyl-ACP dehydratase FabZ family protein n=1 Tax=unclassified Streptomyces TaxID=2593676 RepID=UPI0039A1282B
MTATTEVAAGPVATGSSVLRATPVDAPVEVASLEGHDGSPEARRTLSAVVTVAVGVEEPVFEGHYPHFPIFPGVCIVDCVHRGVLAVAQQAGMPEPRLSAVESTRFVGAVYPGDLLAVRLELRDHDEGLRCRATASTDRGDAATVRLRYAGESA